jgi:ABC-type branched-subunit amino acid transport system substrate-binding protein
LPSLPYLKEIYDAAYLIALAAERADSTEPAAIRDALREVANGPGKGVGPGAAGWQAAVAQIEGDEDVNYEGASGPIEFDQHGDIARGTILVWKIERGAIVDLEAWDIDLEAGTAAQAVAAP